MRNFTQFIDVLSVTHKTHQKVWKTRSKYPRGKRGHILNRIRRLLHTRQKSPLVHRHFDDFAMEYVIQQICTKQATLLCSTFIDAQYAA